MEVRISDELDNHVIGKGMEEDRYLFIVRYWQFPEQLHVVKEAEGEEKSGKVGTQWHGLGVTKLWWRR